MDLLQKLNTFIVELGDVPEASVFLLLSGVELLSFRNPFRASVERFFFIL